MRKRLVGLSNGIGCLLIATAILATVSCKSPLDVPDLGYVTVDFSTGEGSSRAAGVLPADVKSVVISVKADDMDTQTVTLTAPALTATLDIPAGAARQFEVIAKNADGVPLYQGKQTMDIDAGAEHALSVTMRTLYKLLYDPDGATSGTVPGTLYRAATDVVTVAPNSGLLVNTGFTFGGWYTQIGGVNTTYVAGANLTMPAGDVVLFAKWDPLSSAKDITAFNFAVPAVAGVITGTSIAVTVPFGTDVTSLSPVVTHTGAGISPALDSAINFTSPVAFIIAAADSTTKTYTVTVTIAPNTAKDITAFGIIAPFTAGIISGTAISVGVPAGTNPSALIATFTAPGASVTIGATPQVSGTTSNDFTGPVLYTVTAADASTQVYTVTLTVAPSTDSTLSSLVVNSLPIAPTFIPSTTIYTASATSSFPTISVTPTKAQAGATIEAKINSGGYVPVTSGTATGTMMLDNAAGINIVQVRVTAQDGITTATYTVTISKTVSVTVNSSANGSVTADAVPGGTQERTPGTIVALVATPAIGHSFQNWTGDGIVANPTSASTSLTVSTLGTTTTANFIPGVYPVNFDANLGTGSLMSPLNIAFGNIATLTPNTYIRTGFTFDGWGTAAGGPVVYTDGDASFMMNTEGATLYAQWSPTIYTVSFDPNGGTGSITPQPMASGSTAPLSSASPFIRTGGWFFEGWATSPVGAVIYPNMSSYTMGVGNVTLYAQWTTTVTYDSDGGLPATSFDSVLTPATTVASLPAAPSKAGYYISGWYTAVSGGGTVFNASTPVTGSITVYACWKPYVYAVNNANPGGIWRSIGFGANWSQVSSVPNMSAIASSNDGTRLVAVAGQAGAITGGIYTSSDSGTTWALQSSAGVHVWLDVASSASGQYLVAAPYDSSFMLWTSNNYGITWVSHVTGTLGVGGRFWTQVVSSADGSRLAAVNGGDTTAYTSVFTSTDYGVTWTKNGNRFGALASSADGMRLIQGGGEATATPLQVSTDGGMTWGATSSPNLFWTAVAMSDDGMKVVASAYGNATAGTGDYLYTSTDGGLTWTARATDAFRRWSNVVSSSDGTVLSAVVDFGVGNYVWTSIDSGVTWVQQTTSGARQWTGAAMTRN